MKVTYTGHYVNEKHEICVCLSISVGGGPSRFVTVPIFARGLDNEDVHNAMAHAALSLQESHSAPPWEEDALPLWS